VSDLETYDEQTLSTQLQEVREEQRTLSAELGFFDEELASMETERQQFALLQEVCVSLEKLGEMDADGLFWDGYPGGESGAYHVRQVRDRVDEFYRRFGKVESLRLAVLEKLEILEEQAYFIEDDLLEFQRIEEEKKLDWVIEREIGDLPPHATVMPWSRGGEDDRRFRKSLASTLLASFLFAFVISLITVPVPDVSEPVELPERVARLIQEQRPIVTPPPKPIEKPVETPTEEQIATDEKAPKSEPRQSPKAEQNVESKGVLAFRENFAALADNVTDAESLLGAKARINRGGGEKSSRLQRSMVTTSKPGSSSGINLAALSRGVVGGGGGSGMEGVAVGQATSAIAGIRGPERPLSGGGPGPARTDEEIQIVFDAHKAALYRLYNRALRQNPTLQGRIVLKLTIEPDGSVPFCEVESNDMKAPKLGEDVVSQVKTFDFGAKEGVSAITILYPIDFLPAT